MKNDYDIIIVGAGIAGLWIGNTLQRAGYNLILVEKEKLGAGQTLASQGMIHGGQKYALQGLVHPHLTAILNMPKRWDASFRGQGDVDLSAVRVLSDAQIIWPAGTALSSATVLAVGLLTKAQCRTLRQTDYPEALKAHKRIRRPVYLLPEKVIDVRSLIMTLAEKLEGRIVQGDIGALTPAGEIEISGRRMRAGLIIFAAGEGNETACHMLGMGARLTQRRPLRQVMVRPLPDALFGHGFGISRKPRVTVTSHSIGEGQYVWYLGGAIAESGAKMSVAATLRFARRELEEIFPHINWATKEWAAWHADRAEPFDADATLPEGPHIQRADRILLAWPTKLTFVPGLADRILEEVRALATSPRSPAPPLPVPSIGSYPWEGAAWETIA